MLFWISLIQDSSTCPQYPLCFPTYPPSIATSVLRIDWVISLLLNLTYLLRVLIVCGVPLFPMAVGFLLDLGLAQGFLTSGM